MAQFSVYIERETVSWLDFLQIRRYVTIRVAFPRLCIFERGGVCLQGHLKSFRRNYDWPVAIEFDVA